MNIGERIDTAVKIDQLLTHFQDATLAWAASIRSDLKAQRADDSPKTTAAFGTVCDLRRQINFLTHELGGLESSGFAPRQTAPQDSPAILGHPMARGSWGTTTEGDEDGSAVVPHAVAVA